MRCETCSTDKKTVEMFIVAESRYGGNVVYECSKCGRRISKSKNIPSNTFDLGATRDILRSGIK